MPLIFEEGVTKGIVLKVWKLDEPVEFLRMVVPLDSVAEAYFDTFRNEKRKKQWLGYRMLLNQMLSNDPPNIEYNEHGKPFIPGANFHFSVSHSADLVAVIIDQNNPVGIDVEKIRDRIFKVKERFLSEAELYQVGQEFPLEKLHVCWGAKESLFKTHGIPDVDFKTDMHLPQFDYLCCGKGRFTAELILPTQKESYTIRYQKIDDYMLVWAYKEMS